VGLVDRLQAGDPSQIGPFRLLGRLGEGGMGRVFLGESRGGRKVAVKVVHPHYASDPEFRRRFAREVAAARQVGGFHTAGVVGADPGADPPWMATAYIPGPSLAEEIAQRGPLDEAGVLQLGAALAEGLAAIHDCGLIHRDLKPGNVILADDGPRIIDFGIARGADATALTGSNAVIGTLRYMSPEQLHGQELTPQSDVFALGTVLAYAATGHDPFQGPTMPAVITRILTGPPDLDPLSGDLRGIIADCLAKDPGSRPSPGDLLARFSDRRTHDPTVTAAPAPAPTAVPSPEPRPAEAGGPARAAREPSFASTVNVSPAVPPGRTDPPAARAITAPPPARKPARRRSRRRTGLIAAGTAAVVGLAIYVALPAGPARTPPRISPTSTASSGSTSSTSGASSSVSGTGRKVAGGTATVALPAGVTLSYIFPYTPAIDANEYNAEGFQMLMYRPLYMFGDNGTSVSVNYPLSVANAPVYSPDGKTVTITMKGWKWSDGESVSAQDVIFWLNMMKAEPSNYYGYVPGLLPDNLASYSATGPDTVVLHLKSAVSSVWFTYNQLAMITPMPGAWDVTKAGAKPGSGGCATDSAADKWAKCTAVYKFLAAQANSANRYASNPIWGVVDGPWKLSGFSTAGTVTFVPNASYSGSPKPTLSEVKYLAYANDTAEYKAVKNGQVDVGYIPPQDLPQKPASQVLPSTNPLGSGFTLAPSFAFGIQYFLINFNNPTVGPAFKQLYVRQALQEVVDQPGMITAADRGYGYPTSGGVPSQPASQWVPAVQNANGGQGPYPFSIASATSLLASHGWAEVGGVMTCQDAAKCGPGVTAGSKLSLTMDYTTGVQSFQQEVAIYKSDASQAGIDINLVPQSFDTIIGESVPCSPGPSCSWDILNFGGWNFIGPGFEPTGEPLFATGAVSNSGSYSDSVMDELIDETHASDSLAVFKQYATYAAEQLPFIWMPNGYSVEAVNSKLANVTFNPLATFLPEYWYFTK
jgi:peptide/nickel transport system substrate-binding protein